MESRQLTYLSHVAQSHSLSQTAEAYYTSHQVVRNAITKLELELNVQLIVTNNQKTVLTPAGEILVQYAKNLEQQRMQLAADLEPYLLQPRIKRRNINLFTTPHLADGLMLSYVEQYCNSNANLAIELCGGVFPDILESIQTENDILVMPIPEQTMKSESFQRQLSEVGMAMRVLCSRKLFICSDNRASWAKNKFIDMEHFEKIPLVTFNYSMFPEMGSFDRKQYVVNNFDAQKRFIKAGKGVGIYTEAEFSYYAKNDSTLVLINTELENLQYIFVHKKDFVLEQYILDFLEFLKKQL